MPTFSTPTFSSPTFSDPVPVVRESDTPIAAAIAPVAEEVKTPVRKTKRAKITKAVEHEPPLVIQEPPPPPVITFSVQEETDNSALSKKEDDAALKKRGRKPKGGKIVQHVTLSSAEQVTRPNIILHLKCYLRDLLNNEMHGNVESYNNYSSHANELYFDVLNTTHSLAVHQQETASSTVDSHNLFCQMSASAAAPPPPSSSGQQDVDMKQTWKKLKKLEHDLHINVSDKRSACFYDTCPFDSPPIYIPKHFIRDSYQVYGCFCSPECAVAYLFNENIDSSVKFERYHLLNHIYGKIFNYTKNIKPAPNPCYMLDKFSGNLTIQEYRALLRTEQLFLIVDKPLTRILPELHEDNDDFLLNNRIAPSTATHHIKKPGQRKPVDKTNILTETFGLHPVSS